MVVIVSACRSGFCLQGLWESVQKLPHAWSERGLELCEGRLEVFLECRNGQAFDKSSTEIERGELSKIKRRMVEFLEWTATEFLSFWSIV